MLQELIKLAKEAGKATLQYYDEGMEVYSKDDDSPLTKADLASHHVILDGLKKLDPGTPVISEESGIPDYEERRGWDKFWIVDPLDGTKEFIKRNGEFTVNIALIEKGEPVIGVVYIPAQDVCYHARKGEGAFKQENDKEAVRIHSSKADTSRPLNVMVSRSHGSDKLKAYLQERGIEIGEQVPAGSSLKFCLVAEGKADIYPRLGPTMEWDVAAGDCVYRNSAKEGQHDSPLTYNKPTLKNEVFVIGL